MAKKSSPQSYTSRFYWPAIGVVVLVAVGAITVSIRAVDILGLVAAATSSIIQAPATLYLTSYDDLDMQVGDVKKIDVAVNARTPINAVGATIKFPQDSMEVLGFTKEKSFFDLWTEETAINEDTGEIHFSGGTTRTGGLMGTGTVLTLTVRAKKSGQSTLYFKDSQVYSADGKGTLLDNDARTLTFDVQQQPQPALATISSGATPAQVSAQPQKPLPKSADLNGDGAVNLIDMSIMIIHMMMVPYDQRYDLNMDGFVNISDLSVLLSQVH